MCVIISKILFEYFVCYCMVGRTKKEKCGLLLTLYDEEVWIVMGQTHVCALSNQFEYQMTSPLLYGIPGIIPL